ncbi:taurine ABC transporter permease [Prauserella sp. PE36]|uniref:ABC transporter permease n=1 Tax=Prauserella sp. PE36 TaxID=1504709 RepID=UPI000DE5195F|nr:ABC transporter permease [Prauserella sp. PE36]RBM17703.1 taurine ABC transporter permease [Prauserella sp. PE36]
MSTSEAPAGLSKPVEGPAEAFADGARGVAGQQAAAVGRTPTGDTRLTAVEGSSASAGARSKRLEKILAFASPLAVLLLWDLAARTGLIDPRFFPAPSAILVSTWNNLASGYLLDNMLISLRRVGIGFLVGVVPGVLLGLVLGFSRLGRAALLPLVQSLYPIPKSAIAPLLLLIFGLGEPSKWVLVALGVFFPVFFNTLAGVLNLDRIYTEVAQNFSASRIQYLRTVALPGAMPMIMTGLRLGIGMGLILIAVAEIIGADSGLGYMIYNAWELFQVETMYSGLMAIAILGLTVQLLMNRIERALVPWSRD